MEKLPTLYHRLGGGFRFKYLIPETLTTYHKVEVDFVNSVQVVGNGENGAYEWAIFKSEILERHSNRGYGSAEVALRDGLIACLGLPTEKTIAFLMAEVKTE